MTSLTRTHLAALAQRAVNELRNRLGGEVPVPPARILEANAAGTLHFILSDDLFAEYRAVLLRPAVVARHGLTEAEVDAVLDSPIAPGVAHIVALLEAEPQATLVTGDNPWPR